MLSYILWFSGVVGTLMLISMFFIAWCAWRIAGAHERIERHFSAIERALSRDETEKHP